MAEEETEFNCDEFRASPPGAGLDALLSGFTAGLDGMIDPFSLVLGNFMAAADGDLVYPAKFAVEIAAAALKIPLMPAAVLPDVKAAIGGLPPLPAPLGPLNPLNVPPIPTAIFDLLGGLLKIPVELLGLAAELDLEPDPPWGIPDKIAALFPPGFDKQAGNLTTCVVDIVAGVLPLKPYEGEKEEEEAGGEETV